MNAPIDRVLALFTEYASVPHPSGNTKAGADLVSRIAARAGHAAVRDEVGNVLVRVPASQGYETHEPVILQGHLDMVAAREADAPRDPEREGVLVFREGDLLGARGTTLGGDDGAAVAMLLALAEDRHVAHPPLELLFTVDEETGMYGAHGFDTACLRGRRMLNLDSDEEGVLTVGCAGGAKLSIRYPVCREMQKGVCVTLTLAGATGGHSGTEIHRGGVNANTALASLLSAAAHTLPLSLCHLSGGDKDNAIPTHARAVLLLPREHLPAFYACVDRERERLARTYQKTDPDLTITMTEGGERELCAVGREASARYFDFLSTAPCGVQGMSRALPDLVETSLNLGVLSEGEEALTALWSLRSAVGEELEALAARLTAAATAIGASVCREGDYPAWEYRPVSPLRDCMQHIYREHFGKEMRTVVLHAGLECGIFSSRIPGLDCVSFGPNMYDIHTTRERLSVSSLARTYEYLLAALKEL